MYACVAVVGIVMNINPSVNALENVLLFLGIRYGFFGNNSPSTQQGKNSTTSNKNFSCKISVEEVITSAEENVSNENAPKTSDNLTRLNLENFEKRTASLERPFISSEIEDTAKPRM